MGDHSLVEDSQISEDKSKSHLGVGKIGHLSLTLL